MRFVVVGPAVQKLHLVNHLIEYLTKTLTNFTNKKYKTQEVSQQNTPQDGISISIAWECGECCMRNWLHDNNVGSGTAFGINMTVSKKNENLRLM